MRPADELAVAILADLTILGVSVRSENGQLHLQPRSILTPEMVWRIRRHKAQIIEVLHHLEPRRDPPCSSSRYRRYELVKAELARRGFYVLADKPEVVLALLAAAEAIAAELCGRDGA